MTSDEALVHDRAMGAYLGLAIGDALGATVEFMTRREIKAAKVALRRQLPFRLIFRWL